MALNSINDPGFCSTKPWGNVFSMSFFRKSLGDHACLFKQGGEKKKRKKQRRIEKKRKEWKNGVKKKLVF